MQESSCKKTVTCRGNRTYSGYLRERLLGKPFLVLWKAKDGRSGAPVFLSTRQLGFLCAKIRQIESVINRSTDRPVRHDHLPGTAEFDEWKRAANPGHPLNIHTVEGQVHLLLKLTMRSKAGELREIMVPVPDWEPFADLLAYFLTHLQAWPGTGASLKSSADPDPQLPENIAPKPTLPPPPDRPLFETVDEQKDDAGPQPPDDINFEPLEEEKTDYDELRNELLETSDQFAASEEDGWFYPDDEE